MQQNVRALATASAIFLSDYKDRYVEVKKDKYFFSVSTNELKMIR